MPAIAKSTRATEMPITSVETFAKRFVIRPSGCWEWTSSKNRLGYGQFSVNNRTVRAHRVMWELIGRGFTPHKCLDHLCRNPSCVNPDHLEEVTHLENIRRGELSEAQKARHARRTHCKHGHEFNEQNTYQDRLGRSCRACKADWARRDRASRRAGIGEK